MSTNTDNGMEIASYVVAMIVIGYLVFTNAEESMEARKTMVTLLANEVSSVAAIETKEQE